MLDQATINLNRENGRLDVVKLANSLGVSVRPLSISMFTSPTEDSANIMFEDGKFVITVNPRQSRQRQRFSIAHELAHFEKHQAEIKSNGVVGRSSDASLSAVQESEADKRAAELLVPEDDLTENLAAKEISKGSKGITATLVEELAARYDVSFFAMIVRLREIGFYVPFINVYR